MTNTAHMPTLPKYRAELDKMMSRVFIVDRDGNRCAESLRNGFAIEAAPILSAHDALTARVAELEAALAKIAKESGPADDGPGTIATIGRIARAALAKS